MLAPLLQDLDQRILTDPFLLPPVFDKLIEAQRALGLTFGDRPTCPFLRPHIVKRSQYDEVTRAATTIATAMEKIVSRALVDDELLAVLGPTTREVQLARIDPGYAPLCVSSRLDSYLLESGFQFLEYNAETPAGVGDQMQLEKVLFELPHLRDVLSQHAHWRPQPHKRLLTALVETYREWGGDAERPQIAIVDWKGVATESEFIVLRDYFAGEGYPAKIVDPRDLSYDGHHLWAGDFRIDIVYKRVVIHEFLTRCEDDHPLVRAYADARVCLINSFRTKLAHKKASFAILSDPRYSDLFTADELETFRRHIPWTRRVTREATTFHDAEEELPEILVREQQRLVLKPNDDYGGHGVFLGWETNQDDWKRAIELALAQPYVVQERAPSQKISIPTFGRRVQLEELFVDFNPFLFDNEVEGALIRLSSSSLLNVTSGGGQTALLVLEGM